MRFDSFLTALTVSNAFLGAFAGPLAAKRQDASSSITATSTATQADETASSTSSRASIGLVVGTNSDGSPTTFEVVGPQPTGNEASTTGEASATATGPTTTYTFSRTGQPAPISTEFPACHDTNAKPFCLPNNMSTLYVGKTYYVTWNPDFFDANTTVQIKVQWANDSTVETWSSDTTENSWGYVAIDMKKEWLQGYSMYNLTFRALNYDPSDPKKQAEAFDGPMITLQNEPPHHLPPSAKNSINKEGLMIGLPVGFGFVLLVVLGLYIGMRKQRIIGVGNIMGRRGRGYGVGKSKRQRLGLGKKGAIRLEERDVRPQYNAAHGHARGDSLGSLVSDDGIRPAPGHNQFRDEIQRQRTGR